MEDTYIRFRCKPELKNDAKKLAAIHSKKTGINIDLSEFIRFLIKKYKTEALGGDSGEFSSN